METGGVTETEAETDSYHNKTHSNTVDWNIQEIILFRIQKY